MRTVTATIQSTTSSSRDALSPSGQPHLRWIGSKSRSGLILPSCKATLGHSQHNMFEEAFLPAPRPCAGQDFTYQGVLVSLYACWGADSPCHQVRLGAASRGNPPNLPHSIRTVLRKKVSGLVFRGAWFARRTVSSISAERCSLLAGAATRTDPFLPNPQP